MIASAPAFLDAQDLPPGWTWVRIGDVADLNPRRIAVSLTEDTAVTVVPMAAVDADHGTITDPEMQPFGSVRKGLTPFQDGDVIMAKITPCMENGKAAVARGLTNGVAFGSTEFHVLRPSPAVLAEYLYHFIRQESFRGEAEANMSGNVGQRRVPAAFLADHSLPLPPLAEQHRIVAALDAALTRVHAARERLARVREILKRYRAAVLSAAVEGRLTEDWRAAHPDAEPAETLLHRILDERRRRWEEAEQERYAKAGKTPPFDWRSRYKEPAAPDTSDLPALPEGWCWTNLQSLAEIKGGITKGQKRRTSAVLRRVPYLRVANVQRGYLDLTEIKVIEATEDEINELRLAPGDMLFTEGGDRDKLGRGWIWSGQIADCIHQNHIFRARVYSSVAEPKFISWYGNVFGQQYFLDGGKQTVNLASINLTKLGALPVALPSHAEQHEIVSRTENLLKLADAVEARVERAAEQTEQITQALLAQAFRGELVAQDSADEPAAALLERVRAARATDRNGTTSRRAGGRGVRRARRDA